jgi:hypothetical protein
MRVGQVAADAGVGLVAGVAGTVAMTVSSTVEMRLRGRQASNAPADAAGKVFGVRPVDERAKAHVSQLVHCGYGIAWGAVRGMLAGLGLPAAPATGRARKSVVRHRADHASSVEDRSTRYRVERDRDRH